MASTAPRPRPSSSTSRCVTKRTVRRVEQRRQHARRGELVDHAPGPARRAQPRASTMFVSTAAGSTETRGQPARPSASARARCGGRRRAARRGGRARRGRRRRDPGLAHAAAEQLAVAARRAISSASSRPPPSRPARRGPSRSRPTPCRRPPRPAAGGSPSATAAFQRRAPSMCTRRPCSRANAAIVARSARRDDAPAQPRRPCSRCRAGADGRGGRRSRRATRGRSSLDVEHAAGAVRARAAATPQSAATPPCSWTGRDASRWTRSRRPGRVCEREPRSGCPSCPTGRTPPPPCPARAAASALERDHGRVVALDVVAHLGLGHRLAHLGRRPRDGVGAEVDWCASRGSSIPCTARVDRSIPPMSMPRPSDYPPAGSRVRGRRRARGAARTSGSTSACVRRRRARGLAGAIRLGQLLAERSRDRRGARRGADRASSTRAAWSARTSSRAPSSTPRRCASCSRRRRSRSCRATGRSSARPST